MFRATTTLVLLPGDCRSKRQEIVGRLALRRSWVGSRLLLQLETKFPSQDIIVAACSRPTLRPGQRGRPVGQQTVRGRPVAVCVFTETPEQTQARLELCRLVLRFTYLILSCRCPCKLRPRVVPAAPEKHQPYSTQVLQSSAWLSNVCKMFLCLEVTRPRMTI